MTTLAEQTRIERDALFIREDHVLLREEFYDEEMLPVKAMTGEQIESSIFE